MAITGAEFGGKTDEEALAGIDDLGVIAQVTPEHKVRWSTSCGGRARSWRCSGTVSTTRRP
jgi:hypothetical protein